MFSRRLMGQSFLRLFGKTLEPWGGERMYDLYAVQDVIPRLTPQLFGSRNNKTGNCIHIVDDIKVVHGSGA